MTVAIMPITHLIAANAALEDQGFGPNNFSVAAYAGPGATHAALHAWHDPLFDEAVRALPNVTVGEPEEDEPDDPVSLTEAVITDAGAQWGANAPSLEGQLTSGTLYRYEDDLWWVITGFDREVYGDHPDTYPALMRRVRDPHTPAEWTQPIDQFDSFRMVNPFTGKPDETIRDGNTWVTLVDNNVWPLGEYGWVLKDEYTGPVDPGTPPVVVDEWPAWKPWTSGLNADLHQVGAKVSHKGSNWIATAGNNHWEPGTYGWAQQP